MVCNSLYGGQNNLEDSEMGCKAFFGTVSDPDAEKSGARFKDTAFQVFWFSLQFGQISRDITGIVAVYSKDFPLLRCSGHCESAQSILARLIPLESCTIK